jgi:hypothetical protein
MSYEACLDEILMRRYIQYTLLQLARLEWYVATTQCNNGRPLAFLSIALLRGHPQRCTATMSYGHLQVFA